MKKPGSIYRNRLIINQRGGSIDIDNTTEREKVKISHRSGSNISISNVVTSELATNNKQERVINDSFESTGGSKSIYIGKNLNLRTCENSYSLKGFTNNEELDHFTKWKEKYGDIVVSWNSQFKMCRGGFSIPGNIVTPKIPLISHQNPTLNASILTCENTFSGYDSYIPVRLHDRDEVSSYEHILNIDTSPAKTRMLTPNQILGSAGPDGSKAPGVLENGPSVSSATENWTFAENLSAINIDKRLIYAQNLLNEHEEKMGNGGDEFLFTKRNKFEQVGIEFNDYPSIRVDPKGRSYPYEMLVSSIGPFKNHDRVPLIEECDNTSTFPGGNDEKIVGNRYSRHVGSGGVDIKTCGTMELGATQFTIGASRIHINANHGISIASESFVELQSLNSITLRTNRQVFIDGALGVNKNLIVGGGLYVEGELYCQHITAPIEVHETQDTIVASKFAVDVDRRLVIGEAHIGDLFYPVYALAKDDIIISYPHSHHHNGLPIRLAESNGTVRAMAESEHINNHDTLTQSLPQVHERKSAHLL